MTLPANPLPQQGSMRHSRGARAAAFAALSCVLVVFFAFALSLSAGMAVANANAEGGMGPSQAGGQAALIAGQHSHATAEDDYLSWTDRDQRVVWYYYSKDGAHAAIVGYKHYELGTITQLTVPDSLPGLPGQDDYEVTQVDASAFKGNKDLVQVDLPTSIAELEQEAFAECSNLETVTFGQSESLHKIPAKCFYQCKKLESIAIPAAVKFIGYSAFEGCSNLESVGFGDPSDLETIELCAFKDCTALRSIELQHKFKQVGDRAFFNCASLESLSFLRDRVDLIGISAFAECTSLKELHFPDEVGTVGACAFESCTSLKLVAFGKQLPTVFGSEGGQDVFLQCDALQMMYFPGDEPGATGYDYDTRCKYGWKPVMAYLVYISSDDGKGVVIDGIAPSETHTSIALPAKLGKHPITAIDDGAVWHEDYKALLTGVMFPDDCQITSIGVGAFLGCKKLSYIQIPSSVMHIRARAFKDCTSLENAAFYPPSSLETIGEEAFSGCSKLKSIEIPPRVQVIAAGTFQGCGSLESITLPKSLRTVEQNGLTGPYPSASSETCDKGCATVCMPDANDNITFYGGTGGPITNATGKETYQVTYGSWSDKIWLQGQIDASTLSESNRQYVPVNIADPSVELEFADSCTYNGEIDPVYPRATKWSRWLRDLSRGVDYVLEPADGSDCHNAGKGKKAVVKGQAPHFKGTKVITYEINQASISDNEVVMSEVGPFVWDNNEYYPDPTFTVTLEHDHVLHKGTDYEIEGIENNKWPAQGDEKPTIHVNGLGNYTGKKDFTFTIEKAPLHDEDNPERDAQVFVDDQVYTGAPLTPVPTKVRVPDRYGKFVNDAGKDLLPLNKDADYTLSYNNNTEVGEATMTLTGAGRFVDGTKTVAFNIVQSDLSKATVDAVPDQVYTGSPIEPDLVVKVDGHELVQGVAYTVEWENNVNAGSLAKGTITGKGSGCTGTCTVEFKIVPKPVTVTPDDLGKRFGDADPTLTATVEGLVGSDSVNYSLSRKEGENVGTYDITASGDKWQGNYEVAFKKGKFTIRPASIVEAEVADIPAVIFDGGGHEPVPVVAWRERPLSEGTDYDVSYQNNVHAGDAAVIISGKGNFEGEKYVRFTIKPLDISGGGCNAVVPHMVYTGQPLQPYPKRVTASGRDEAVLTLAEHADYEVTGWEENVEKPTGYVLVEGLGDYGGTLKAPFSIISNGDLTEFGQIGGVPDEAVYTGGPIEPDPQVYLYGVELLLRRDVEYKVEYENNVDAGVEIPGGYSRARVIVTGLGGGGVHGSCETTFLIKPADIAEAVVAAPDQIYDGTAFEPVPTVTWNEMVLLQGKDYDVTAYAANVHAGTATVTVTGKGNFTGTASGTFKVAKRPLAIKAESATREYDGTPLTAGFTSEGLAQGDRVASVKMLGSQVDAGSCLNVGSDTKVVNAAGEDVTADYGITYAAGMLTIEPYSALVSVEVTGHSASYVYDGEEHAVEGYDVSADCPLYDASDISFTGTASVKKADVGSYAMGLRGKDFANASANFSHVSFKVQDGTLTIYDANDVNGDSTIKERGVYLGEESDGAEEAAPTSTPSNAPSSSTASVTPKTADPLAGVAWALMALAALAVCLASAALARLFPR